MPVSHLFQQIFTAGQPLSLSDMLLALGAALVLALIMAVCYMAAGRKRGWNQSFVLTLVMIPPIISLIVMVVGNSTASALSLGGALAIIRFRTLLADPRDVAYLFFAVAVGLSCGIGYLAFAALFVVVMSLLMIVLEKVNFAAPHKLDMTVRITVAENMDYENLFEEVFAQYSSVSVLAKVRTADFGSLYELFYHVTLKDGAHSKEFIDALRTLNGNLPIQMTVRRHELVE